MEENSTLYEVAWLLLQALEFNANCSVASYNTSDADREACLQHVFDTYDLFKEELDTLFSSDEDEDEDEDDGEDDEETE